MRALLFTITLAIIAHCPMIAQVLTQKVAVVSLQGAIVGTKEGQRASKELDAKVPPKQKEFEQRQGEIAQLEDQLNRGSGVLSDDKRT
jgi:outer membrane protein